MEITTRARAISRDPERAFAEVGRRLHRLNPINVNDGVNFLEKEWDILIILDACRYDFFDNVSSLPGKTDSIQSLGSTSAEFIENNFAGQTLYDTVYVSSNGWYENLRDEIDSDIYRFIYTGRDAVNDMTCRPETVTDRALEANSEHPNKRLIVHYMQPHHPYLGPTGESIEHHRPTAVTVYRNNLSVETLQKAYKENLEIVLEEVERLFERLEGRMVVTADHGDFLGEKPYLIPVRDYGHPRGIRREEVTTVPWHVYESGSRKILEADKPFDKKETNHEIEQHLKNLGYKV
ncbi:hypothetical protein QA600_19620 [Natronococcus sp. A-GB1]|uniref:hypothetical protein n=1 Tax=Natronococcus sp. A-GB1 TaxID=3037648 RepID=UPI00241CE404|nr:hypothetical protein [Natronococcus sp. A-GB1]MDG5761544.1 hypothetical protein [Natronococcus sp. A-GB1]